MNEDDIDWINASSDFGLVELCREIAALAQPLDSMASLARVRSSARRRVSRSSMAVSAISSPTTPRRWKSLPGLGAGRGALVSP